MVFFSLFVFVSVTRCLSLSWASRYLTQLVFSVCLQLVEIQ